MRRGSPRWVVVHRTGGSAGAPPTVPAGDPGPGVRGLRGALALSRVECQVESREPGSGLSTLGGRGGGDCARRRGPRGGAGAGATRGRGRGDAGPGRGGAGAGALGSWLRAIDSGGERTAGPAMVAESHRSWRKTRLRPGIDGGAPTEPRRRPVKARDRWRSANRTTATAGEGSGSMAERQRSGGQTATPPSPSPREHPPPRLWTGCRGRTRAPSARRGPGGGAACSRSPASRWVRRGSGPGGRRGPSRPGLESPTPGRGPR
jgi:hypothetical protein